MTTVLFIALGSFILGAGGMAVIWSYFSKHEDQNLLHLANAELPMIVQDQRIFIVTETRYYQLSQAQYTLAHQNLVKKQRVPPV